MKMCPRFNFITSHDIRERMEVNKVKKQVKGVKVADSVIVGPRGYYNSVYLL